MNKIYFFRNASRLLALAMCVCVVALAGSCDDKDDGETPGVLSPLPDNKIVVNTVEDGAEYSSEVDEVKAQVYDEEVLVDGQYEPSYHTLATAEYSNGRFTISLPATVGSQYLEGFGIADLREEGLTVNCSAPEAMRTSVYLSGHKEDVEVGRFYHKNTDQDDHDVEVDYMYVDRDVTLTITGSYVEGDDKWMIKWNISLKKGWNIVYYIIVEDVGSETATTTAATGPLPSGLEWHFYPSYGRKEPSKNQTLSIIRFSQR